MLICKPKLKTIDLENIEYPLLNLNWLGDISRNISHLSKIADLNNLDITVASAMGL